MFYPLLAKRQSDHKLADASRGHRINQPNDPQELKADHVADQVIRFGKDRYASASENGRRLLAHELAPNR